MADPINPSASSRGPMPDAFSLGKSASQAPQGAKPTAAAAPQPPSSPFVSGFRVQGKRLKGPVEISKKLVELSFLEMSTDKDSLLVLNVESRDMQKNPYLFSIVTMSPSMLDVTYTCLPNMSPKKRRIEVLRHFLNLLTICEDCYDLDIHAIYQLLEGAVADMNEYVSLDYNKLFSLYDNLKAEHSALQKKANEMGEATGSLSKENYELKTKNDELTLQLKKLETYSDSVLSLKIEEWLSEHKGEINIAEFSKVYNVPETRVEQILNKLVTEGYIETKG